MATSDSAKTKKLQERYKEVLKKFTRDPPHGLPEEDGTSGTPLLNLLADRCIAPRADKFEALKKRKEVFGSRTKYADEDIEQALILGENDVDKAVRFLQGMKRAEDNLVSKRGGHATRAQVRYALKTCKYEEADAEYMLVHDKEITRSLELIKTRLGTASGLGYPTTAELQLQLVKAAGNEGTVMAGLKKKNRMDVEMMLDCIAAAEVEEMLTPERCDAFGFSRLPTAEEQKHIEDAYLYKFERDNDKVVHFFTQAGTVMRRSVGKPPRNEVEALLDELGGEAEPVIAFLQALQNMQDIATKNGNPQREDIARYLRTCGRDEEASIKLMQTVHKMSNPKPPKPPPKGSKKPAQPHLAAQCGFPSRVEAEWGLRSTRAEDKEGKPLLIEKALELLTRLHAFDEERNANPDKFGMVGREDIVWALDPERTERLVKLRPLSHEEYTSGASPASILLMQIGQLLAVSKTISGGGTSVTTSERQEAWAAIEKFQFNQTLAQKYITGVKTLMLQQAELSIESREEVDAVMESQNYDDQRVLLLMQNMAELQKQKAELGNPSRTEIKDMLLVAWDDPDRVGVAAACLKTYRQLLMDDGQMMSIFGKQPNEGDTLYMRQATFRFKGNKPEVESYMKKVAELVNGGEALGNPSRELVISVLDEFNGNNREAHRKLRDEHWKVKDAELKEEYRRNREKAEKEKQEAANRE